MARTLDGNEHKIVKTFRIEPSVAEQIAQEYGSISAFINEMLQALGYIDEPKRKAS